MIANAKPDHAAALPTYTPSNGAMIVCANGTGDYVKTTRYLERDRQLKELRELAKASLDSAIYLEQIAGLKLNPAQQALRVTLGEE